MRGPVFSVEEKQIIINKAKFMTAEEISKDYLPDRTPMAIRSKATRMGISLAKTGQYHHTSKISNDLVEVIKFLYDNGWSVPDIQRLFTSYPDISYSAVRGIAIGEQRINN